MCSIKDIIIYIQYFIPVLSYQNNFTSIIYRECIRTVFALYLPGPFNHSELASEQNKCYLLLGKQDIKLNGFLIGFQFTHILAPPISYVVANHSGKMVNLIHVLKHIQLWLLYLEKLFLQ